MKPITKLTGLVTLALALSTGPAFSQANSYRFQRIATIPVVSNTCLNKTGNDLRTCTAKETSAEIVTASEDGNLLIYSDSLSGNIGFVDISNPASPKPAGVLAMPGDPTSVAVAGNFALVGVNTGSDNANPSGNLVIVNLAVRTIVRTIPLPGQPDSVSVSPDRAYALIAIENERNEDFCVGFPAIRDEDDCERAGGSFGTPPQTPPGMLVRVVLANLGNPNSWTTNSIPLTGIPSKFPTDPEPEFVDINSDNIAVVTLQENNHIVLVDLASSTVTTHFPAGDTNLSAIDTNENDVIELVGSLNKVLREPDGVSWIDKDTFVTADEGDLDGGSRGFTIFNKGGAVLYASGNQMDHIAARIGHYPEGRSENKGNETEGVETAYYPASRERYIFAASERSSFVGVFAMNQGVPAFVQALPASAGPEGLLALPARDLFISTGEEDIRGAFRGSITIYRLVNGPATYPDVQSADDSSGRPITWAALSGLGADPQDVRILYSISDSAFAQAAIFTMDIATQPAAITKKTVVMDGTKPATGLDLEGIAARSSGGFWLASEGAGSVDEASRPVRTRNRILRVSQAGLIEQSVELPASVNALQRRFGFEGVAVDGSGASEFVYVAFQREWVGDPAHHVRIGRYDVRLGEWTFIYYQKAQPTSPNGGWTGLSDISVAGRDKLAVIERDNQGGPDGRIKEIRSFSIAGVTFKPQGQTFDVITRAQQTLVRDLVPSLLASNGYLIEKVEGMAITKRGEVIVNTDNDGIDDHSGETRQVNLGRIF
ncbi:MAG: esterase-like activity of phytase family protein [Bryobacteraceae bacterium]|nr:esterase-like activity of phytase family protein [Bryobacteraceae bacterium]